MGKLDISCPDLENPKGALVPENPVPQPLVPVGASPPASAAECSPAVFPGPPLVAAGGAEMVIISMIDTAIKELGRCCAEIAKERERTRQVQAYVNGQIETAKQQTRQVKIQQKEETRRFAMQCKKELELKRMDLEELRERLRFQGAERRVRHQDYMSNLDMLEKFVNVLILQSNRLCAMLLEETDRQKRQDIFQQMDRVNEHLKDITIKIVDLREG